MLSSLDNDLWQEVIKDEIDSLESNKTWHSIDLPLDCKPMSCNYFFEKMETKKNFWQIQSLPCS
jgi:hypothetical protein